MSSSLVETVDVEAPIAVSWALWSDVAEWPKFLSHVKDVVRIDNRSFNWWLSLPGAEKSFTAEITELIPQERIAWKTTQGVEHAGVVTFHRISETKSRVTLQIEYNPQDFIERLGALTNLDSTLTNYDLGEFKRAAEKAAGESRTSGV